jgi:Spy/CpxP family protein refolding chaperone
MLLSGTQNICRLGGYVQVRDIVGELDREIARLKEARALLAGGESGKTARKTAARKKRHLTPEGRKRIQEALKRRWAKRRKEAGKPAKK